MNDCSALVVAVIAETFSVDPQVVGRDTVADDIDGWDSLAHTVLMVRLEKRLGMRISQRTVIKSSSVGALIDLLNEELLQRRSG